MNRSRVTAPQLEENNEIEISPEAFSDAKDVMELLNNIMPPQFEAGRKYEIRYDTTRLTADQVAIVKEYIKCLKIRVGDPKNIKVRPYSSTKGSKKSLISVECTGENFRGEGHVDIELPKGQSIRDTLLRIPVMMNIAIASSNIPENLAEKEVRNYDSVIRFIQSQFRLITGKRMVLPGATIELAKALKWIVLTLPEASKKSFSEIDKYNEMAKKALFSV
jgi:hypothetical protein